MLNLIKARMHLKNNAHGYGRYSILTRTISLFELPQVSLLVTLDNIRSQLSLMHMRPLFPTIIIHLWLCWKIKLITSQKILQILLLPSTQVACWLCTLYECSHAHIGWSLGVQLPGVAQPHARQSQGVGR